MRIAGTIAAALLLALTACKGPESVQDANAKVATFHKQLDAADYPGIWNSTGPDMRIATSQQQFTDLLTRVHEQMGKVKESKQIGWQTRYDNGNSFSELTMKTTFERGNADETFVYRNGDKGQTLAGYHIKPSE